MNLIFKIKKHVIFSLFLLSSVNIFSYSYAKDNNITFKNSITETYRNSLEIKAEKYRLAAIKHSLGEAYSSKDWNSSYTANLNSSNKQSDFEGSYVNDDVITSTLSLSKNLFDGGKKYEKTLIAKDNVKMHIQKLKVVEQNVILKGVKAYLDVYSSQSVVKLRSISLERFKGHVKAANLKLSAGTVTPTVVAESDARLAKAKYEFILAEGNSKNAFSSFKSITKIKNIPLDLKLPIAHLIIPLSEEKIIKISKLKNPSIIISQLINSIAKKNIDLDKTVNRPTLKLEFQLKDNQSSVISSTSDYQSYGANIMFNSPLFYNYSSRSSLKKLDKLYIASSIDLSEKYREIELEAISSLQSYKTSVAKTLASKSEKMSSFLALNGIKKESEYGVRTILDVLDAEVDYLNASANLIKSQADQIYNLYVIKSILGELSINDFNDNYKDENKLIENKLKFNVIDTDMLK